MKLRIFLYTVAWACLTWYIYKLQIWESQQAIIDGDPSALAWHGFIIWIFPIFMSIAGAIIAPIIALIEIPLYFKRRKYLQNLKTKQVIVMRQDLGMTRGKQIAQGCHASLAFLLKKLGQPKDELSLEIQHWLDNNYTKVCLRVDSEEELLHIYEHAKNSGLEVHLVTDIGLTQFKGVPTNTCLAIGPDDCNKIDMVTGDLKLL